MNGGCTEPAVQETGVADKEKVRPTFVMQVALAFSNAYCTRVVKKV